MDLFATVLACLDGRIQRPLNDFLRAHFGVHYLDTITRPGMIKFLASNDDPVTRSVINDLDITIRVHDVVDVALLAHFDCRGNPENEETQHRQLQAGLDNFRNLYPDLNVVGLWLAEDWIPHIVG